MGTVKERFAAVWERHLREIVQFLSVGGMAFIINASVTWTLMHTIMGDSHTKAKVVAGIVATIFSWIANRLWTFREKRTANPWREAFEFAVVNALGILVEASCVFISYYALGFRTEIASFISGTIIGTILGTIFRYFLYRYWVFNKSKTAVGDKTRDETIADILEEATEALTGRMPVVRADQIHQSTHVQVDEPPQPPSPK